MLTEHEKARFDLIARSLASEDPRFRPWRTQFMRLVAGIVVATFGFLLAVIEAGFGSGWLLGPAAITVLVGSALGISAIVPIRLPIRRRRAG